MNSTSGAIAPSSSTSGNYIVNYTIAAANGCDQFVATTTVTVTTAPTASISYSGTPYCNSITSPQAVTLTGSTGGTYSSTTGLSVNSTTGDITPSTSTSGTYTVTYTVTATGGCGAANATASVEIDEAPIVADITTDPTGYCPGDAGISFTTYSANANSFVWSLPSSVTITSGLNTQTITVNFESDYTGGTLSVSATNLCGTTASNPATLDVSSNCDAVWNGSVSNVWGVATNWTPARIPGNITVVSIPAGTTNAPVLNNSNKSVGKITIDAGATVTISGTSTLSVYGDFTNNGTISQASTTTVLFTSLGDQAIAGNLNTLKNIQIASAGTTSLGNDWNLDGTIRFVQGTFDVNGNNFIWDFDNGARVDFVTGDAGVVSGSVTSHITMPQFTHYIASPLSGVDGSQLADNVQVVSGSTSRLYTWNFATQAWVKQLTPASVSLNPSLGARMYFPDAPGDLVDFTGTYDNTASYTTAAQSNTASGKFIIAGNPYPSALDWEATSGWSFNNVSATIYYWSQSKGTIATYTRGTGVSTNGGGRYIPVMQSFFVTTTGGGGTASLGISNPVRSTQSATMYRTALADNIMTISVKKSDGDLSDETVIYLTDGATANYEGDLDAYKMKNDETALNLYTELDGIEYAVNALPSTTDITIPLSLTVPVDGNYVLSIPANADMILVDKQAKKQKAVDGTAYNFSSSTSDASDRFELQMRSSSSSNTSSSVSSAQSVSVASNGSNVVLISKNDMGASTVTIYSTLGVEVAQLSGINVSAGSTILNSIAIPSGSYIVKVQNNDNQFTGHVTLVK